MDHLNAIWRGSLGLGLFPALAVLLWRLRMEVCPCTRCTATRNHLAARAGAHTVQERLDEAHERAVPPHHQTLRCAPCRHQFHMVRYHRLAWRRPLTPSRFVYDFITYPFGLYGSTVLASVVPSTASLAVVFGWNVVIKCAFKSSASESSSISDPPYATACSTCLARLLGRSPSTTSGPNTP